MTHRADPESIPETALDWHRAGRGAVLATVVETWGSAPRPAGSQLVIAGDGAFMGSVSGGCVEGAVVLEAAAALTEGRPRLLSYGVSDGDAFAVGLACGGRIRVLLQPVGAALPEAVLAALVAARTARRGVALLSNLTNGAVRLCDEADDPLAAEIRQALRSGHATLHGEWFIAPHLPPLRLILIGASHIAQALLPMAQACGHDVTLIDPRDAFASPERFPGARILHDWPDTALAGLGLDARTAVVTLSHDAKLDDPAILAALASEAYYIGCLGSTRTHAKRLERLQITGVSKESLTRIHAPVGLKIAAATPAEIAVSILAEIIKTHRQSQKALTSFSFTSGKISHRGPGV
ncbi:XdhC family protein [Rhodobacter ferrooxidans]|nr:XdhC/CoxI family protein [Rhodobacter sp. SW2]